MSLSRSVPRPQLQPTAVLVPAHTQATYLRILIALAFVEIFCLWVCPLTSSLWLDELVTFWSACKGIVPAIERSQFWPGQNAPYTVLIAAMIRIAGTSEVVLRLPSLAAALVTAWLMFRLGERFMDREAGVLVLTVFASLHEIAKSAAANARPYAIALLLVVVAISQLVRWLDTKRLRNIIGFILAAAAIPYFHLLFTTTYLVFLAYGAYMSRIGKTRMASLLLPAGIVAALVTPLIWTTWHSRHGLAQSSFTGSPDLNELLTATIPPILAVSIFLGLISSFTAWQSTRTNLVTISPSARFLAITWLIIPLSSLFLVSRFTPLKVFVPRYYIPSFAAIALIAGCGLRMIASPRVRMLTVICVAFGSIVSYSGYHLFHSPHREDWRAAANLVRGANLPSSDPVLLQVGLLEARNLKWGTSIDRDSPLLCPLSKYPIPGRVVLLPFRPDREYNHYMEDLSLHLLTSTNEFLLVSRGEAGATSWLRGWLVGQGFTLSEWGHSEGVPVFLARRVRSSMKTLH
jgi:hypothetical protein